MGEVRFLLDGETIRIPDADPTGTVLEWLRYQRRRTGAKEGCAEGDCGACTVLVGELDEGAESVVWRAVNACILFLPMLDGRALMTVESLSGTCSVSGPKPGELAPVQQALVDRHGSQCGFCTPGIVMSLQGRAMGALGTCGVAVGDVLSGNLCRCTGYGPILQAGECVSPADAEEAIRRDASLRNVLLALRREERLALSHEDALTGTTRRAFAPRSSDELAALLADRPEARLVAGATDVGLWVTKQHRSLDTLIFLQEVRDLRFIEESEAGLRLGACVRYAEAHQALARLAPDLGELVRRIGGTQIRNAGTIGGNIANGSPIGDMPPALIAMDATLTLRRGDSRRTIALENFFIAYGRQDHTPGEFVESIFIPRPAADMRIRIAKLSKRFDSDISAVCGAFALTIRDGWVEEARIAFGGMAGTPLRARHAEAVLTGAPWSEESVEAACSALARDYAPLTDVRGSAFYRLRAAANLLRRIGAQETDPGAPLSVLDSRLTDSLAEIAVEIPAEDGHG